MSGGRRWRCWRVEVESVVLWACGFPKAQRGFTDSLEEVQVFKQSTNEACAGPSVSRLYSG